MIVTNFQNESAHPQVQQLCFGPVLVFNTQPNFLSSLNILITLVWIVMLDLLSCPFVDNPSHLGARGGAWSLMYPWSKPPGCRPVDHSVTQEATGNHPL